MKISIELGSGTLSRRTKIVFACIISVIVLVMLYYTVKHLRKGPWDDMNAELHERLTKFDTESKDLIRAGAYDEAADRLIWSAQQKDSYPVDGDNQRLIYQAGRIRVAMEWLAKTQKQMWRLGYADEDYLRVVEDVGPIHASYIDDADVKGIITNKVAELVREVREKYNAKNPSK
jgi:hypothetical protein